MLKSTLVAPSVVSFLQSCHDKPEPVDLQVLSTDQHALLNLIADLIIPRTDTPSASDVGVVRFLDLLLSEVFEIKDTDWRGIGTIPESGYGIKEKYRDYDIERVVPLTPEPTVELQGCLCGEVLQGMVQPTDCPLFAKKCTPENPFGACMVSSEGSCAASYKYRSEKL